MFRGYFSRTSNWKIYLSVAHLCNFYPFRVQFSRKSNWKIYSYITLSYRDTLYKHLPLSIGVESVHEIFSIYSGISRACARVRLVESIINGWIPIERVAVTRDHASASVNCILYSWCAIQERNDSLTARIHDFHPRRIPYDD